MSKKEKQIGFGLKPLPEDGRDFDNSIVFGALPYQALPEGDWLVIPPSEIKDQGNTDFCTGFTLAAVLEDHEGVQLNPEYAFAKGKQLENDWESWGLDLRTICKVAKQAGVIEQRYYPYPEEKKERNFIANWANWIDSDLDLLAWDHAQASFFRADKGPHDIFDNIRMSLYQHHEEMSTILVGSYWRPNWTYSKGGVIPKEEQGGGFGHAFKIFGQKVIDGEIYLCAQNSWGTDMGDQGIYYFPREVVNREFKFGAFMFVDMPADYARYHNEYNMSVDTHILIKAAKVIGRWLWNIITLKFLR